MKLANIKAEDIVLVNKNGRIFYAIAGVANGDGTINISPMEPRQISYRSCKGAEVRAHWRKTKTRTARTEAVTDA